MIEAAHAVLLHEKMIGTLFQRGDVARFAFADDYWSQPDRPVLGLSFEDNPRASPRAALRLPPWFSNLLPEGPLRQWIAHERGVNVDRELQLLLQIGSDLPGAVRIIPNAGDARHLTDIGEAATTKQAPAETVSPWKFSLAGVGLKFSLLKDHDRLTIPGHDELGNWIVKFPDAEYPQLPANEYGIMQLAGAVGIDVPRIELVHRDELPAFSGAVWRSQEEWAFAIERFDRGPEGTRIHIEDFAQVRGWYPDYKYNGSFETIIALAYRTYDRAALREAVRRITFNLLVGNGDAHLKNWSLIYPTRRKPTLSPAYDLVCTGCYYDTALPDDMGLKLGGTRRYDRVSRYAFTRLQDRLDTDNTDVISVVDATIAAFFEEITRERQSGLPDFVDSWVRQHAEAMRQILAE